jgi:dihydropteroate synthase
VLGGRTRLVGIVNATPDSFFEGGRTFDADAAVALGERLVEEGADWLDVGGESTRPGAEEVPGEEEMRRVLPVIERLARALPVPISVDTRKASVAEAALDAGAWLVNDVSGGRHDPRLAPLLARRGAPLVVNHLRGDPRTMQREPRYDDPVVEIGSELRRRLRELEERGLDPSRTVVDPGIGFGKRPEDNLAILRRLPELRALGRPILVGPSRKSFLAAVLGGRPPEGRLFGTAAAVAAAAAAGAEAVRVHDVAAMRDVVLVAGAIAREGGGPWAG